MSDEAFRNFTEQDARHRAGHDRELLMSADVIDRYFATLTSIKMKVELTIAAKRADLRSRPDAEPKELEEFEHWRAGALRFKTSIDELIIAARLARKTKLHSRFEHAIRHHMEEIDPDDASGADWDLWGSLDNK